ncbi:hypothetical protein [Novosphingobium sp.]|jgi:hypothetical protein|uniref:hypothetical protein n=1 Tax=Novosphingobium sp. TaxID=1874826 RepID=UPI002FE3EFD3
MTSSIFPSLVIAAFTFATGYGDYTPHAGGMAGLTRDEERYILRVTPQIDACGDPQCKQQTALKALEIINLRRALNATFVAPALFDALRNPCENLDTDLDAQLACFRLRKGITFEAGMKLAGFTRAGITRAGYSQIRIGMQMKEVEFILGDMGDEVSYVSSGGYSTGSYRWQGKRGTIIVTFKDDEVSGRTQVGVF